MLFFFSFHMTSATENIKAKFNPDFAYFKQGEMSQTGDTGLSQG